MHRKSLSEENTRKISLFRAFMYSRLFLWLQFFDKIIYTFNHWTLKFIDFRYNRYQEHFTVYCNRSKKSTSNISGILLIKISLRTSYITFRYVMVYKSFIFGLSFWAVWVCEHLVVEVCHITHFYPVRSALLILCILCQIC